MRHFHLRFFALYFGAFLAVLVMLRLLLALTEPLVPGNNRWVKERIRGQLGSIAELAGTTENVVLFLGASEVEVSFDPLIYDKFNRQAGKSTYSFNMGIRNNGTFLPLYFERIADELERHRVRPKIIFVHFPVSRLTTKALDHFGEFLKTHDLPAVYFEPSLWSSVPGDTEDKIGMLGNKWLWGERSLMQIPVMMRRISRALLPKNDPGLGELMDVMNDSYSTRSEAWSLRTRGRFYRRDNVETKMVQSAYSFIREGENLKVLVRKQEGCCGFVDLRLDPDYTKRILQSMRRLSTLAEHIVIVNFKEIPAYPRSEDSAARRDEFLLSAAEAAGGKVLPIEIHSTMYLDLLHLSPIGTRPFANQLSQATPEEWLVR
jgi:hypothetical protein